MNLNYYAGKRNFNQGEKSEDLDFLQITFKYMYYKGLNHIYRLGGKQ